VDESQIKENIFLKPPPIRRGVYVQAESSGFQNQDHTNEVFSEKWSAFCQSDSDESDPRKKRQYQWYLTLYGYTCEQDLANTLRKQRVILDAGCGLGYKAAWFARLAPDSLIVCMDFSDAIFSAAERYQDYPNIVFVKGDIANTGFRAGEIDMVNCDQVLHHTESPQQTLHEFSRITKASGLLHAYVYARKALPRELLDDHFRKLSKKMTHEEIWALSEQLTELGKTLAELQVSIDVPEIPALGIKRGKQNIQRFVYWNFLKCFWNEELGRESSISANFDWYSPSNAFRYDKEKFIGMCKNAGWGNEFLHMEEACWSGRFIKQNRKDGS